MKRYIVFSYDEYYPNGGMNDFIGDYEIYEHAVQVLKMCGKLGGHVYDIQENKKVFSLEE